MSEKTKEHPITQVGVQFWNDMILSLSDIDDWDGRRNRRENDSIVQITYARIFKCLSLC